MAKYPTKPTKPAEDEATQLMMPSLLCILVPSVAWGDDTIARVGFVFVAVDDPGHSLDRVPFFTVQTMNASALYAEATGRAIQPSPRASRAFRRFIMSDTPNFPTIPRYQQ